MSERTTRTYEIRGKLAAETERAIQIEVDKGKKVWLPKSQIEITEDGFKRVIVDCPEWLIEKNGLEDYAK